MSRAWEERDRASLTVVLLDTCGLLWSAHGIEDDDESVKSTSKAPLPLNLVLEALVLFLNSQVRLLLSRCAQNTTPARLLRKYPRTPPAPPPPSQALIHEGNQLAVFTVNDVEPRLAWESKNVAVLFDPAAHGGGSVQWHLGYTGLREALESSVRASGDGRRPRPLPGCSPPFGPVPGSTHRLVPRDPRARSEGVPGAGQKRARGVDE